MGEPKQSRSWRDQIKVHPAANLFPMMTPDELKALGEDIKKNGLQTKIAVWQAATGRPWFLIDGRNRLDAAELVGLSVDFIKPDSVKVGGYMNAVDDCTSSDPYEYVISTNVHRRHLTPEQKREIIAALLKAEPEKSNRQVAKAVGVSHPHVAAIRHELERSGDVETVTTSTDTLGRKQPIKQRPNAVAEFATPDTRAPTDPAKYDEIVVQRQRLDQLQKMLGAFVSLQKLGSAAQVAEAVKRLDVNDLTLPRLRRVAVFATGIADIVGGGAAV